MKNDIVVTFKSTHQAMKGEDFFKEAGLDFELIPTPRKISAECGFALLVRNVEVVFLKDICRQASVNFSMIYLIKENNGEKFYEESN